MSARTDPKVCLYNQPDAVDTFTIGAGWLLSEAITTTRENWLALAHQANDASVGDFGASTATAVPHVTFQFSDGQFSIDHALGPGLFTINPVDCKQLANRAAALMQFNSQSAWVRAGGPGLADPSAWTLNVTAAFENEDMRVYGHPNNYTCQALVVDVSSTAPVPFELQLVIKCAVAGLGMLNQAAAALAAGPGAASVVVLRHDDDGSAALTVSHQVAMFRCGDSHGITMRLPAASCIATFTLAAAHYRDAVLPALQAARASRADRMNRISCDRSRAVTAHVL